MPLESLSGAYFDTPARAERLQLLLHLVNNVADVVYLRAPAGAGKTTFARRLSDLLGSETAQVWLADSAAADIVTAVATQLGLSPEHVEPWPRGVLNAISGQDLLVVADDAEHLDATAVAQLAALHAGGGRLLLLGEGALVAAPQGWSIQYVDLPPFDREQSTVFLRARAGEHASAITDDLAAFLFHAAHGRPGPLLDALGEVLARARPNHSRRPPLPGAGRKLFAWAAGGGAALLLAILLLFQGPINELTSPPAEPAGDSPQTALPPAPIVRDAPRVQAPGPDSVGPASTKPAGPPPIALPEVTAPAAERPAAEAGGIAQPATAAPGDDPLDAVMRDALAAVKDESGGARAPTGADTAAAGAVGSPDAAARSPAAPIDATVAGAPAAGAAADNASTDDASPAGRSQGGASPAIRALGAPVVEPDAVTSERRDTRTVDKTARAAPAAVVERSSAPAPTGAARGGLAWLRSRAPQHYTLQLIGARDRAAVEGFARRHRIGAPHAVFERSLDGRPWYSLVAGDYPDRDAAVAARAALPKALASTDIWPRTFESIQKDL